jgi:hypothetical protein
MKELTKYEDNYDIDPFDSLKKMVDLYDLIKKTNFHDIGDRIELWLDEYGDENIIEYIKNTKNPYLIGTLIGKN